ncbi:hypothetical protein [Aurantiacibacter aquimixticola]|uniref:Uncharacterized protein n=1 Tax=Aurantiacibacter aquimixticola TaxID=1958945 RepID=A0A419RU51_9SPHN|nr:hypothetical protein [Aurantiacibacter aquimixticola]RJY09323.1 hypothetical protein D6201_08110 [Aurantiacibacter aquimixticola]
MQTVLQFFVQILMALFGAIGTALATFGVVGVLCGGGVLGGGWCWRAWKRRALRKAGGDPD